MPTFRKSVDFNRIDSDNELPLGIPIIKDIESCKKLNDFLRLNNAFLIVKIHPMQDLTTVKIRDMSNILVLDANTVKQQGVDNYRLMKDVDALISDYSSAAYDFMHADKPIAFTLDDAEDYKLGFLFENPLNYMPGILYIIRKNLWDLFRMLLKERILISQREKEYLICFMHTMMRMVLDDWPNIWINESMRYFRLTKWLK